jgi:hypothetical protein
MTMPDSTKLKTLRDLQFKLQTGQIRPQDMDGIHIADTDGRQVALSDPDAADVLGRRIAAEEAAAAPAQ